jgi:hypothetical protein
MKDSVVIFCFAAIALPLAGCGGDDDCEVVCAKNVECQLDSPGKDACVAQCEDLSEDSAYADGIAEQAACYEDQTCDSIEQGACSPNYS